VLLLRTGARVADAHKRVNLEANKRRHITGPPNRPAPYHTTPCVALHVAFAVAGRFGIVTTNNTSDRFTFFSSLVG
jgi:hypothetical protein